MEESTVIQLYQFIANYTAYSHLYGHLIIVLRSNTNSSQSDTPQRTSFPLTFANNLQSQSI